MIVSVYRATERLGLGLYTDLTLDSPASRQKVSPISHGSPLASGANKTLFFPAVRSFWLFFCRGKVDCDAAVAAAPTAGNIPVIVSVPVNVATVIFLFHLLLLLTLLLPMLLLLLEFCESQLLLWFRLLLASLLLFTVHPFCSWVFTQILASLLLLRPSNVQVVSCDGVDPPVDDIFAAVDVPGVPLWLVSLILLPPLYCYRPPHCHWCFQRFCLSCW
jgi:hypothetical protein